MTTQSFTITPIQAADILRIARERKAAGRRFVECHANRPYKDDRLEVTWSFANDDDQTVEVCEAFIQKDEAVDSVSHLYPCAFPFENEMHDLYGVTVRDLLIDYQGGFYRLHFDAPMLARPGEQRVPRHAAGDAPTTPGDQAGDAPATD